MDAYMSLTLVMGVCKVSCYFSRVNSRVNELTWKNMTTWKSEERDERVSRVKLV